MAKREGFFFYESFIDAARTLPEKQQGAFLLAVYDFVMKGIEPNLKGAALSVWTAIRRDVEVIATNRENGAKGGPPKGNTNNRKSTESQPKVNRKSTESQPVKNKELKRKESTVVDEKRTRENVEMYLREKDYTQLNATEVYDKLESENVRLWQRYIDTWAASTPKPVVTHTPDVSTKEARYRAMMGL